MSDRALTPPLALDYGFTVKGRRATEIFGLQLGSWAPSQPPESQQIVNSTSSSDSEDTDDSSDSNETNSSSGTGSSDSDSNVELEENIDMYSRYFGRQVPGEFM